MTQLPKIQLVKLVPFALLVTAAGFCLMQTDDWMNAGAIVFSLGLLPLSLMVSRMKD